MTGPIVLKFTLSKAEYISAVRQHLFRSKTTVFLGAAALFWGCLPLLSYLAGLAVGKAYLFPAADLIQAAIGLALAFLLFGLTPYYSYRKTNPAVRNREQEFRFTEGGAEILNGIAEGKMDWKAWVAFKETDQFFMLYPNPNVLHILPKRAFGSTAEMDAFRELLKRKIQR